MTTEPRTVFTIRIAGPAGQEGVHRLRTVLKRLVRDHGFICLHAHEERDAAVNDVIATEETRS